MVRYKSLMINFKKSIRKYFKRRKECDIIILDDLIGGIDESDFSD